MSIQDVERNVAVITERAVAGLSPAHQQRRIAYCVEHDEHGVRIQVDHGLGTFMLSWGGEPLVSGPLTALYADEVPDMERIDGARIEIPDSPAGLFGD